MFQQKQPETNSIWWTNPTGIETICLILCVLMLAAERRHAILRALNAGGAVRVADLAAELDVSEMTVRRDLDALDAQNLLRKVHGGAVSRHNRGEEPWSSVKAGQQRAEKAAIAALAARNRRGRHDDRDQRGHHHHRTRPPAATPVIDHRGDELHQRLRGADRSRRGCRRRTAGLSVRRRPHPVGCARRTDRRRRDLVVPGGRHVSRRAWLRSAGRPDHTQYRRGADESDT